MDEMNIVSEFTTSIISKIIKRQLRKKLGCDISIQLNEMRVSVIDGKALVHLDATAQIEKDELVKALKSIGLD